MGNKDQGERIYLQNPAVFADACNYALFGGEDVIKPDSLKEQNIDQLAALINKDFEAALSGRRKVKPDTLVERFRDIYNEAAIMSDGDTTYILIGIEAQTEPNREMAARVMLADALSYATQVRRIRDLNRAANRLEKEDFIAGLLPDDRIRPVISLVILFSPDEWNVPRNLSELFEAYDPRLAPFIQDYHINLIAPSEIEDCSRFRSTLGPVMEFIKKANDTDALRDLLERNSSVYANLEPDAARVLGKHTNIDLQKLNHTTADKGGVNMWAGWEGYVKERVDEGVEKGIQERMPKAVEEAMAEALPEAVAEAVAEALPEAVAEALPEAVAEALPEAVAKKEQEWQVERTALTTENSNLLAEIARLQEQLASLQQATQ